MAMGIDVVGVQAPLSQGENREADRFFIRRYAKKPGRIYIQKHSRNKNNKTEASQHGSLWIDVFFQDSWMLARGEKYYKCNSYNVASIHSFQRFHFPHLLVGWAVTDAHTRTCISVNMHCHRSAYTWVAHIFTLPRIPSKVATGASRKPFHNPPYHRPLCCDLVLLSLSY